MTEPAKDDARNPSLPEWVINEKEQPAGAEPAGSSQPDAAEDQPSDAPGPDSA